MTPQVFSVIISGNSFTRAVPPGHAAITLDGEFIVDDDGALIIGDA